MENIRLLREKLDKLVGSNSNIVDIYKISRELDAWIVEYYKEK